MKALPVLFVLLLGNPVWAQTPVTIKPFQVEYHVTLIPASDQAKVRIVLGKGAALVHQLSLRFDASRYSAMTGRGQFSRTATGAIWKPDGPGATLSYTVKISRHRDASSMDARMTSDWAIFRGDNIVPRISARLDQGARARATLEFTLPANWRGLDIGYPRIGPNRFRIHNPNRRFDQPTGWMIAGNIGLRRDRLGLTELAVAAPLGTQLDRMDALTFLNFLWPEVESAFGKTPPKILIVSAGNPMWRGGLSSPNSFFLHADRPLISENATSPLVHELTHVITGIHGDDRSDWIAEGIAEFYSIELPWRAGGMTASRHDKVYADLAAWSREIKSLRGDRVSGKITARAVLLLRELDAELRKRSAGSLSLDDLVQKLRGLDKVSTAVFIQTAERLAGGRLASLHSSLLAD